ncbi:MAG: transcriptional regulator [Gammaproteobacteria bacterium]|jgi:DNA-binding HxlR family transcriptional regulator|nr:transcriptional regulator [Gammaproteobacteria bacterium]
MSQSSRAEKSSCPISYSLDLFGDKWTLLVLRDLILWGKTRFAEFQAADEKIASNILSDRLRRLQEQGIVEIEKDPSDARQKLYTVTKKGLSLTPVLLEIAAWGASQDPQTGAPDDFAADFYADRETYYAEHRSRIAGLFEKQNEG